MSQQTVAGQLVEIYTLMSRSAMNKEYYGISLSRDQRISNIIDIVIAVGATGSSISGLAVWITQYGKVVWALFSIVATLLALAKPILQLNKSVERHARLFAGHSDIYANMMILASRIKRHGDVSVDINNNFEAAEARFIEISKDDDPNPNMALLKRCEDMIRIRHPADSAWYPKEEPNA